jgi:6-phosphogluconolactonase
MKNYFFGIVLAIVSKPAYAQGKDVNLLIGTYTKNCDSKGIYLYSYNQETAQAKLKSSTENAINPSYLALSPDRKYVYCVNEDGNESKVSAFQFDSGSGRFTFLNSQKSEGNDPCHIVNDAENVIIANYSGGNITVFGKNPDGSLGSFKQVIKHEVKANRKDQPNAAHMHMVQFTPDKKRLVASDLGNDR